MFVCVQRFDRRRVSCCTCVFVRRFPVVVSETGRDSKAPPCRFLCAFLLVIRLVVVNFDVIAWFTHNAKLRLIANCRLRDHSRITHYPFTQSLQKLPLPGILFPAASANSHGLTDNCYLNPASEVLILFSYDSFVEESRVVRWEKRNHERHVGLQPVKGTA